MSKIRWTKAQIERSQIEAVFGLGGGELKKKPWRSKSKNSEGQPSKWCRHHWYEGPPDYATRENENAARELVGIDKDYEIRTAIECRIFGASVPPKGWTEINHYRSGGECDCPFCGHGTEWEGSESQAKAKEKDPRTNTGYRGDPKCKLCEGSGYVYIGDGYCEAVYAREWK